MNDAEFKSELMKRTKDVLADRIIELTTIADKSYDAAIRHERARITKALDANIDDVNKDLSGSFICSRTMRWCKRLVNNT